MTSIHFDFSKKGGPRDVTGVWESAPARTIRWPDGNVWSKSAPSALPSAQLLLAQGQGAQPKGVPAWAAAPAVSGGGSFGLLIALGVIALAGGLWVRTVYLRSREHGLTYGLPRAPL